MDIVRNISNSLFGVIGDLYKNDPTLNSQDDKLIYILIKENRHLYLALLLIFIIIVYGIMYKPPPA